VFNNKAHELTAHLNMYLYSITVQVLPLSTIPTIFLKFSKSFGKLAERGGKSLENVFCVEFMMSNAQTNIGIGNNSRDCLAKVIFTEDWHRE
jgi:hypothetical protein